MEPHRTILQKIPNMQLGTLQGLALLQNKPIHFSLPACFLFTTALMVLHFYFKTNGITHFLFKHSFPMFKFQIMYFIASQDNKWIFSGCHVPGLWGCLILEWLTWFLFHHFSHWICQAGKAQRQEPQPRSADLPGKLMMAWMCSSKIHSLFHIRI